MGGGAWGRQSGEPGSVVPALLQALPRVLIWQVVGANASGDRQGAQRKETGGTRVSLCSSRRTQGRLDI